MAAMTPWVRRYNLRDLLDDSFDLFRERATSLLLAGLVPSLLVVLFLALVRPQLPGNFLANYSPDALAELWNSPEFWYYVIGLWIVSSISFSFMYIAQLRIAVAHLLGVRISLNTAYRLMTKPFWSLLLVALIFGIFAFIACIVAFVIGAIVMLLFAFLGYALAHDPGGEIGSFVGILALAVIMIVAITLVGTFFAYAPTALAQDHAGPFTAMGRSFRYASANFKAYFWAIYAYLHIPMLFIPVIVLFVGVLNLLGQFADPSLGAQVFLNIGVALGNVIFWAMMACLQALIYIDSRSRVEGFDLVLLAHQIGLGPVIEDALRQGALRPVAAAYPNYAAAPQPPRAYPDYSALPQYAPGQPGASAPTAAPPAQPGLTTQPAQPGLTAPPTASGYPDYSAPPPPVTPTPVYSTPPPTTPVAEAPFEFSPEPAPPSPPPEDGKSEEGMDAP